MKYRTPLSIARGLGSSKDGLGHWWMQRLTSVALVPLVLWFVVSIVALAGRIAGMFWPGCIPPFTGRYSVYFLSRRSITPIWAYRLFLKIIFRRAGCN